MRNNDPGKQLVDVEYDANVYSFSLFQHMVSSLGVATRKLPKSLH